MSIGQKQVGAWLAVLGALAIAGATLTPVSGASGISMRMCLICHDRGMADFISNIILFAPFAFGLALCGRSWRFTLAAGALFSLTVELLQLGVVAGRDPSLGDLVANSTGAVSGWWLGATRGWWRPSAARAHRRAVGVTLTSSVLLLGALSLFRPAPQDTTYYLQWTPALGGMHLYLGEVMSSRLGPMTFQGPGRIAMSDSIRTLLHRPDWRIAFTAGPPPQRIAPINSIYDENQDEVILLGAVRHDFVYRQQLLAKRLLFDGADLRMTNALKMLRRGQDVALGYRQTLREHCLTLDDIQRCESAYTIGDTWSLLMFPKNWSMSARNAMTFVFLLGLFGLSGSLAPGLGTLGRQAAVAGGLLLIGPPLLGFAVTPMWELLVVVTGLFAGWGIARLTRPRNNEGRAPYGVAPFGADPGRPRLKDSSSGRSYTRSDGR